MSYALIFAISLGSSQTGLSLNAQLIDSTGSNSGSPVTTGFVEIGSGNYLWNGTIPDDFYGIAAFNAGGPILAISDINPPLDSVMVETGVNARQALTIIAAALAGDISTDDLGNVIIKGMDNTGTTRITAVAINNNRSSVTLNLP